MALDTRIVPLRDADGQLNGVIGVATDVTARLKAEEAVRETEARFQDVVQAAPIGICILGERGVFEDVNATYAGMLGYAPAELVGQPFAIVFTDDQRPVAESAFQRLLASGGQSMSERVLRRKDGSLCTALGTSIPLSGADGRPRRVSFVVDINERKRAEDLLAASEARFRALTQNTSDLVCILGPAGDVLYESPSYARFLGESLAAITARHGTRLAIVHPDDHAVVREVFQSASAPMTRRNVSSGGCGPRTDPGGPSTASSPITPTDPAVGGIVVTNRDITAQKRLTQQLAHAAHHDALTGLPNRVLFQDRLEHALRTAERDRSPLGLLLIDLDGFKAVNDTHGHAAGDALLRTIGARLHASLRGSDTAARLGGDEFGVLLPQAGEAGAVRVAVTILAALAEPVELGALRVQVGASIGIALYPEHGEDAETLLHGADTAMYAAKRAGGGCLVQGEEHAGPELAPRGLGADLRRAVAAGELRLQYQPVVHGPTRRVVRVEALVRWEHPRLGLLPPDQFIPVAERTGAITALTRWVLDETIRQGADWLRRGLELGVSVNLSPVTLGDPRIPELIATVLTWYGLPAEALTLEITESTLLAQPERAVAVLEALARLGVRLAIDDFGSGYSSISQLRRLPVQEIKLDRVFLAELGDAKNATLLVFLLGLGAALGVEVVVEGVATTATWDWLEAVHCEWVQGFYVSPPQPPEHFERWLAAGPWRPRGAGEDAPAVRGAPHGE